MFFTPRARALMCSLTCIFKQTRLFSLLAHSRQETANGKIGKENVERGHSIGVMIDSLMEEAQARNPKDICRGELPLRITWLLHDQ